MIRIVEPTCTVDVKSAETKSGESTSAVVLSVLAAGMVVERVVDVVLEIVELEVEGDPVVLLLDGAAPGVDDVSLAPIATSPSVSAAMHATVRIVRSTFTSSQAPQDNVKHVDEPAPTGYLFVGTASARPWWAQIG